MHKYLKKLYEVQSSGVATVYPGLNAAKGILILLVIFTHSLPPGMILYFNYLFHMPVFMAISGFLLKRSVFQNSFRYYFRRLLHRLIIPWGIACLVYLPFQLGMRSLTQYSLTDALYPYFHLWYIPAYVLATLVCFCLSRFKIPVWIALAVTGLITFAWFIVYRDSKTPLNAQPLFYLGEKRYYAYLFFFIIGYSLRNNILKLKLLPLHVLLVFGFSCVAIVYCVYSGKSDQFTVFIYMLFNVSLVLFLLMFLAPLNWMQNKLLLHINKQSLGIYLYHPFIMFSIYQLIGHADRQNVTKLEGLGVGIAVVLLTLPLIWLIKNSRFANQVLLGIVKVEATSNKKILVTGGPTNFKLTLRRTLVRYTSRRRVEPESSLQSN